MPYTGPQGNSTEWQDYLAENSGITELAIIWTFTGVAFIFASARWYVRGWMQRKLWSDDYLIAVSVATGIIACALTTVSVSKGIGRHVEALSTAQRISATLWVYAAYCPSVLSFGMPKLAVIALLARLLVPSRLHFWVLWTMGALVQLALLGVVGLLFGRCQPLLSAVDESIAGHCLNTETWVHYCLFAASFSAFVDFYLAAYPSIVLYKLQMARRKKIILSIALGLGAVSGAVAIYKTIVLLALSDPDFTYISCIRCHLPHNNMDTNRRKYHRDRLVDPGRATPVEHDLRKEPPRGSSSSHRAVEILRVAVWQQSQVGDGGPAPDTGARTAQRFGAAAVRLEGMLKYMYNASVICSVCNETPSIHMKGLTSGEHLDNGQTPEYNTPCSTNATKKEERKPTEINMGGCKGKKVASCSSSSATLGDLFSSLNINISWDIGSNDNIDRGPPPVGLVRKLGHKTRVSLLMLSLHQWMVNNHQVSRKRAPSTIQKKLKGAVGRRKAFMAVAAYDGTVTTIATGGRAPCGRIVIGRMGDIWHP
ncbi:hypothetical protein PG996_011201 [Apiospora saccharicola]|uniref:Rhodopsin domain-containing protein n=1 Tax=Apiospora saccharicola TaxID=335842 RepID=A0ABR1UEE9_9PEZI